jgi:hypothetical protein
MTPAVTSEITGDRWSHRHPENGELLAQGQILGSKGCVAKDERAEEAEDQA